MPAIEMEAFDVGMNGTILGHLRPLVGVVGGAGVSMAFHLCFPRNKGPAATGVSSSW
jgi:hypothetical protein